MEKWKLVTKDEFEKEKKLIRLYCQSHVITICEPPLLTYYLDDAESHKDCTWIAKVDMDWLGPNKEIDQGDKYYQYYLNEEMIVKLKEDYKNKFRHEIQNN